MRLTSPSAHFVSYDSASEHVRRYLRTGVDRSGQWREIAEQVAEKMALRKRLTFGSALAQTLAFSRPSRFYIKSDSIYRIIKGQFAAVYVVGTRSGGA